MLLMRHWSQSKKCGPATDVERQMKRREARRQAHLLTKRCAVISEATIEAFGANTRALCKYLGVKVIKSSSVPRTAAKSRTTSVPEIRECSVKLVDCRENSENLPVITAVKRRRRREPHLPKRSDLITKSPPRVLLEEFVDGTHAPCSSVDEDEDSRLAFQELRGLFFSQSTPSK